jgi:hypothetical protein
MSQKALNYISILFNSDGLKIRIFNEKMLEGIGIDDIISKLPLQEQLSNRGYNPKQLIK